MSQADSPFSLFAGPHHEAFQYLNFEFDGDDLAVISRTAFVVGGNKPPRGHDSNLVTFHRIQGFRSVSPDHEIEIEGNRVLRYERTQHERAPLGAFTLGSRFDGTTLNDPTGLAQDRDGRVYVIERAGRILQFDAAGNFLGLAASAPIPFENRCLSVEQPAAGERSWTGADSKSWEEPANWYYWGRPDTPEEIAVFGSAPTTGATITLDRLFRVKGMRFHNAASYTVAGGGELVVGAAGSDGVFEVMRGQHTIQVPVRLGRHARVRIESGAGLTIEGPLVLDGQTLTFSGPGLLTMCGPFSMGNGRLVLSAECPAAFGGSASPLLDGTLEVCLPEGVTPTSGDRFDLLDFTPPLGGTFNEVKLPDLAGGLDWNTSMLYTTGVVEVARATSRFRERTDS